MTSGCWVCDCRTTCAVHIEDCEGWWLSGCHGSVAEGIFWSTSNRVLTAHVEWLPGVRLRHLVLPVQDIWRVGGCLAVVGQWQSTASSSQRCTHGDCQPFHFPIFFPQTSKMIYLHKWICCHIQITPIFRKNGHRIITLLGTSSFCHDNRWVYQYIYSTVLLHYFSVISVITPFYQYWCWYGFKICNWSTVELIYVLNTSY